MTSRAGTVYLVGSGPGSLAFLTMRGYALLRQADVLVYDALVDQDLLQLVPDHCLQLDVGKRGGQPSPSQLEINDLLVEQAQQGRQVVRLKSGDPFIFGRCASEIEALRQAGCAFEVVPGISSALAAPLLADIPLTDPVLSRCFAVVSAHDPDALDWEALSGLDTLVILMGARHLSEIIEELQRHDRSPQTPIAIIRWAGQPQQQIWEGTLETIGQQTSRQSLSPCVMVIGEVVRLRPFLRSPLPLPELPTTIDRWITMTPQTPNPNLPLTGKTVLVTRAAGQSSQFTTLLEAQGATVLEMPTLEITPPSSWEPLDQAIATLAEFNWLILTSANGVEYFFERLQAQGKDARALAGVKIAVVGRKTAASLQQHGITPDFIPPDFVADALVEHFPEPELTGVKLLFPRVETGGRDVLVKELTAKGAEVVEVPAYESGCAKTLAPEVIAAFEQQAIDIVTFASSKTVKCFSQILQQANFSPVALLSCCCIASIGPQTSASCHDDLKRVDIEAEDYTLEGLVQAIVKWVS
ncbi:MAG: uroporphyrinogen-III C-methyltransferase [Elainellaceae cyanobacterium]